MKQFYFSYRLRNTANGAEHCGKLMATCALFETAIRQAMEQVDNGLFQVQPRRGDLLEVQLINLENDQSGRFIRTLDQRWEKTP